MSTVKIFARCTIKVLCKFFVVLFLKVVQFYVFNSSTYIMHLHAFVKFLL